ncbi:mammalian cell entry protein [Mycobacterium sp. GA-1841]|uniref:MlaD family protein n=1 Tax=Mycobacterium sp. GA-1841 TaxID=1834154 RepID=UPI00096C2CA4|nr:MlaD family protein [Mycobacterium sp. GA-1841]OMC37726.1 mammalian cell entry protein [Mycobacterium sp. GA-1841]
MSRRFLFVKPVIIGLIVVALAGSAVLFVKGHNEDGPVTVTAQFEDSVGLYVGNAVSVLGMRVGKVTAIVPKDTYVEVKLEIDKHVDIPADVQAVTVATSILTDRHIELTPPYQGGPTLHNGDIVSLPRTRTPVEFDRTLAMADKLSRSLGGNGKGQGPLGDLIGVGAQISSQSGPDVKATLDRLSEALRLSGDNGAPTKESVQSIATSLADLTATAADNDTAIRDFGTSIHSLSDLVASENLGTGDTGAQINQILDRATALLQNNREGLKGTIGNFQKLTGTLTDYRRELQEILDVLPLVGTNMYNAVDQNGHALRIHPLLDKLLLNSQLTKEICNLAGLKDLGCATGTISDYGPEFGTTFLVQGMTGLLERMAGAGG